MDIYIYICIKCNSKQINDYSMRLDILNMIKNMGNTLELIGTDKRLSEQDSNTNSIDIETNN